MSELQEDLEVLKKCRGVNWELFEPFENISLSFDKHFKKVKLKIFQFYGMCLLIFGSMLYFGVLYVKPKEPFFGALIIFLCVWMIMHSLFYFCVRLGAIGSAEFVVKKHKLSGRLKE